MSSGRGDPSKRAHPRAERYARRPSHAGSRARRLGPLDRAHTLIGAVACALLVAGCSAATVPRDASGVRSL